MRILPPQSSVVERFSGPTPHHEKSVQADSVAALKNNRRDAVTIAAKKMAIQSSVPIAQTIEAVMRHGDDGLAGMPRTVSFERKGYRDEVIEICFVVRRR